MNKDFVMLDLNINKIILSSKSLFFKTENFIKQTKYVSNIDILISKLCETIIFDIRKLNIDDSTTQDCYFIKTNDNLFSFRIKFGYQIGLGLNKFDIIFFDYIGSEFLKRSSLKIDEYLNNKKNLKISIIKQKTNFEKLDFNKLYLISNISGINLPRLSEQQQEIVETVDKNILVQGVAGSGKTNICIDKIIFTACKNFSGKILYTTFSRSLLIDTKLKVEFYKKDLEKILYDYKSNNIIFLDDDHKKALENKLGIYFFSDDDDQIFEKIEKIIYYLSNKVEYLLIEDIYKQKFEDARFVNERYFLKNYCKNLNNHQIQKCFSKLSRYSKEIIYKEIYGMIFGFCNNDIQSKIISLTDYIQKRQNSFSKNDCEIIYQIALDFKKHCENNNLLDNNLASRKLIEKLDNNFEYSLAIIDEVQDYTQINLKLFKKLSLKIFCVGDALQMINPSYFSFGYLKSLLYEEDLTEVKELKNNYRNTAKIAEIIDNLSDINKLEFGTHNFVLKGNSVDNGEKTTAIYVREPEFVGYLADGNFEDLTLVVSNHEQKKELQKIINNQEILTVSEIKGLERNTVISVNILSTNCDKWKILQQNKVNHKQADENSVYRYYYNLFYVALSRAKQNLFVLEIDTVAQFQEFFKNNFEIKNAKKAMSKLSEIVSHAEFSQQEFIERVDEFIKLEQFDNARFAASKIKDDIIRIDCQRIIDINEKFIIDGKYREAGVKYWEFGMIDKAKEQFLLSGDNILIELIDICAKQTKKDLNIDIVEYFDDVKDNKIAQEFIVEMVKKDLANLKASFSSIKEKLKKGRK